jgi:antirestriction protein ArdC
MTDSSNQLNLSRALETAVRTPGAIMEAYSAFHNYSIGNQLLALMQCQLRGIPPGPIKTFNGWKERGRFVKKGERALTLCMPITYKNRSTDQDAQPGELDSDDSFRTSFMFRPRWFVISQTDGEDFELPALPEWNAERALTNLNITQVRFIATDGNSQGYAKAREIAINPVAQMPHKTFLHEVAHVELGHTAEADFQDSERTPRNLREVEAEAVALLCCEALNLDGAKYCRGYIQRWLDGDTIPESSAKKIFGAAERILKAGRPAKPDLDQN